jgi:hypothetical protein
LDRPSSDGRRPSNACNKPNRRLSPWQAGSRLSNGSHHLVVRDGLRVNTMALPLIFPVSQIPGLSTSPLLDTN